MTRKEEITDAASAYVNSDAVKAENMQLAFGDFTNGAVWADKTMIDKACKAYCEVCLTEGCEKHLEGCVWLNRFKQAMEE